MVGNIIGLVSCLMCAVPFFILSAFGKDSDEPINFWSGDTTLKLKVKNVKAYNQKMALLYKRYAAAFLAAGIGCLILPVAGIVIICLNCTAGLFLVYKSYRKILQQYS